MKKIIIFVCIIILLIISFYFYIVRPIPISKENIQESSIAKEIPAENNKNTIYRISQEDSEVQFSIDEILRGSAFTVIGTTNQIAGDFSITNNTSGKTVITLDTIKIDASTFKTDSPQRDGAIARLILRSTQPENQYIKFTPTKNSIEIPTPILIDTPFTLNIEGSMKISGITKTQTLTITATKNKDGAISGKVSLTLKRSDYNLSIPNIPFVANVADSFETSGTFTAQKIN